jgi:hypothetical protein
MRVTPDLYPGIFYQRPVGGDWYRFFYELEPHHHMTLNMVTMTTTLTSHHQR